ncbi:Major facilitator superfamily domain, general substrate transporter [Penicillium italicum]|uniref:Major facilitator superfamily domain, general substrate transporter n=1 Tax=Penicillium italicum TaxID=40296 RepID=A0A0A2L700_PENIT|nr:Major facilitator superfamily domain, general substrate transporter [Penicillium italicum]
MSEIGKSPEVDTAIATNHDSDGSIDLRVELINLSEIDAVLAKKMALVNAAIDEIGMTPFHWKLFFLNGFGYAVDSVLVVCQNIAQTSVNQEYRSPNERLQGISLASQVGLLVGAAVWGFSADVIGRKLAFNTSLIISAIFVLIAGAMPTYVSFSVMEVKF